MEYLQLADDQFVALAAGAALFFGFIITVWDGYTDGSESNSNR